MKLTIDLSQKKMRFVLSDNGEKIDSRHIDCASFASERILEELDSFLKERKLKLNEIDEIKVVDNEESIVGTRIAKAISLGLKTNVRS